MESLGVFAVLVRRPGQCRPFLPLEESFPCRRKLILMCSQDGTWVYPSRIGKMQSAEHRTNPKQAVNKIVCQSEEHIIKNSNDFWVQIRTKHSSSTCALLSPSKWTHGVQHPCGCQNFNWTICLPMCYG